MKCANPNCGGEWTPPHGKSVTVCPFCQEPVASEKKAAQSFDNVTDTLVYIKEQHGADMLLNGKVYTIFADLTRNQLRDEKDLIKQICEKGALDCLKAAIGKSGSEHEIAIKRALSKLPKYLQDSPSVTDMLFYFAEVLGWKTTKPQPIQTSSTVQNQSQQSKLSAIISQLHSSESNGIIVAPHVGSVIVVAEIDWRVLAVENKKVLLISDKILEKRPYNTEIKDTTWEQCTLRKYLNNDFYNSLGRDKLRIAENHNPNPNNPWYETNGGNATTDKVFLLSLDEVVKYFGDSGALAQKQNVYFGDQYNNARIAKYSSVGACWWWWPRSPGRYSNYAALIRGDGIVNVYGGYVDYDTGGVRPAFWLNL